MKRSRKAVATGDVDLKSSLADPLKSPGGPWGIWVTETLMANVSVKSSQAPWLLSLRPGKMVCVGQECVNFLGFLFLQRNGTALYHNLRGWRPPFRPWGKRCSVNPAEDRSSPSKPSS